MANLVVRDLKFARFEFDRTKKQMVAENKVTKERITFNKIYMFSLMRFLVSSSQSMSVHVKTKKE